jgi:spore maturation protein CgeB
VAKILYIGPDTGTSRQRFLALQRLGHTIKLVDTFQAFGGVGTLMTWGFRTGYLGLEHLITKFTLQRLGNEMFDVVWVDNGETIGRRLAGELKKHARFILNHNLDNPFTARDGHRWRLFHQALPHYDLFATPRASTRDAALAHGATRAIAVKFTADEVVHRPIILSDADRTSFGSEVAFVGTWMPERGPFLKRILDRGVPLRIFGPRWDKAPEYAALSPFLTCRPLSDDDYVKAVAGSKIAIGLLSLGNEDLHTTRSLEIPAIGSLLCAPRTSVHTELYLDRKEAVFFETTDECADACINLLADEDRLKSISAAGYARNMQNNWFNERLCADLLTALDPRLQTSSNKLSARNSVSS